MEDPNDFGEALREYCFIPDSINGGNYGCYSTFELRPEFRRVKKDCKLGKLLLKHLGLNEDGSIGEGEWQENMRSHLFSNGKIHLGWYWDGDGCLLIWEGNKIAYNGDCKCSSYWKWIGEIN